MVSKERRRQRRTDAAPLDVAGPGDGPAFERTYELLAGPVLGYLRHQGVADPEGLTNETFHRVFRRMAAFEGDSAQLRRWVFTIAHNLVVDERRFTARRQDARPVELTADLAGGDAETDALERLGGDWVRATLALLSDDQRDVLLLRFVLDLSLEEVATTTGRSITAVKALQRRGLDRLRRRLDTGRLAVDHDGGPVSPPIDPTFTGVACMTGTSTATPRSNAS